MSGVSQCPVDTEDDNLRLDRWFQRHYEGLSHGRLQKLLRTGQVRVDGKRAKGSNRLRSGQIIRIPPLDAEKSGSGQRQIVSEADCAFVQSLVLFEDESVFGLNKPAGLAVQGGSGTKRHLDGMLAGLVGAGVDRPKLVHRLDKDTSGVLLVARSARVADRLGKQFQRSEVRKQYWALVAGVPSPRQGEIDLPLIKTGGRGQERVSVDKHNGKHATTRYEIIENAGRECSWVVLFPETGRTHQLRAHLAAIGHPIIGDGKYGGEKAFLDGAEIAGKMHLHARQIEFAHPTKAGDFRVTAPLTDHMLASWQFFGLDVNLAIEDVVSDE
jgi:23S rRNA pseudouridine955/2504/2580 synthase